MNFFTLCDDAGWLEPLLDCVKRSPTNVVCPVISIIDDDTLEFHNRDVDSINVGGFDFTMQVENLNPVFYFLSISGLLKDMLMTKPHVYLRKWDIWS